MKCVYIHEHEYTAKKIAENEPKEKLPFNCNRHTGGLNIYRLHTLAKQYGLYVCIMLNMPYERYVSILITITIFRSKT